MIRFLRPFDPHLLRLLVFDLDGTLIDSRLDLIHSVNAALRHIGRPELDGDVIAGYVGDGAPVLMRRALGDANDESLLIAALEYFLSYYRQHKLDHTTVYEGIPEILSSLAESSNGIGGNGLQMAVLSNKPVNPTRDILRALGLNEFFVKIYGGNSFTTKKPDSLGVKTLLLETGVPAEEALMIGDSSVDVMTGRNAGLWTCGVTYGFAPHSLGEVPPDVLIENPKDLRELLLRSSTTTRAAAQCCWDWAAPPEETGVRWGKAVPSSNFLMYNTVPLSAFWRLFKTAHFAEKKINFIVEKSTLYLRVQVYEIGSRGLSVGRGGPLAPCFLGHSFGFIED